jgi:hypothetical protein
MTAADLNASFVAAYQHNQFKTGCMFWQFSSDPNGNIVGQAMSGLLSALGFPTNNSSNNTTPNNSSNNTTPNNSSNNTTPNNSSNNTTPNNSSNGSSSGVPTITYPIRFGYINRINDWSSADGLARSMGVPGYSNHSYNYICFTFWTCGQGITDVAILWDNPSNYFGTTSVFGSNDA